ncbi:MAG: 3-methyl-2-oxobutanoate hydroxymethyltransferase [Longimicrobiales bacterium]|nr:3-methyl-2-oxobutanoate hydroxymethyltransferase [Longimicrobiales bacterium]
MEAPGDAAPCLLIGRGRLARHLMHYFDLLGIAHTEWARGEGVEALRLRAEEARAILLLIPDDAIESFVREHDADLGNAPRVHASGVRTVPGVVGCHPLGSFGETLFPEALYRSLHFVVEAGPLAFEELFPELPNPHVTLPPEDRVRYHTAAVLGGNFTAALWRRAAEIFDEVGLPPSAWIPYLETVSANIRADVETAVTGPAVRGDAGTIATHLEELGDDPWGTVYRAFLGVLGTPDPAAAARSPQAPRAPTGPAVAESRPADPLALFRTERPIVATTAYDASTAALLDALPVDFLLVGDSVAMVVYGHVSTRLADVEMIVRHTAAVRRGAPSKALIADLPWVATRDPEAGVVAARRLLDAGADAVKLEALPDSWEVLARLCAEGVPVMGHVGLLPQLVEEGEFRVAGRGEAAAEAVCESARLQEEAGCFALVVECVPSSLGERVTRECSIPTIGIGAGAATSGQILVIHDLCGLTPGRVPRFVRLFGDAATPLSDAVRRYGEAVRRGDFPGPDESYG